MSIDNLDDKDLGLNEIASDYEDRESFDGFEGYKPPKPPKKPVTEINCALQVKLDPENIAVYICKGSKQCFSFTALKCCGKGDIKITAKDYKPWSTKEYKSIIKWCDRMLTIPNFGVFELNNGGICFTPDPDLGKEYGHKEDGFGKGDSNKSVTLDFTASQCNATDIIFSVTFVYDPCKCCCGCKS